MIVVYFLRGLVDVILWAGLAAIVIGAVAGIVRVVTKTRHGIHIEAEDRRPRFMLRQRPKDEHDA